MKRLYNVLLPVVAYGEQWSKGHQLQLEDAEAKEMNIKGVRVQLVDGEPETLSEEQKPEQEEVKNDSEQLEPVEPGAKPGDEEDLSDL